MIALAVGTAANVCVIVGRDGRSVGNRSGPQRFKWQSNISVGFWMLDGQMQSLIFNLHVNNSKQEVHTAYH